MAICIKSGIQNMNLLIGCIYCYARTMPRIPHTEIILDS